MIHRALIAAISAGLAAGLLAGDAEAGKKRYRNHWFYGDQSYYPGPEYLPPPRYYRNYENISPEEYEALYGDDFDENYYDPYYEPPVRKVKPKKKAAKKQVPASKKVAKGQSPVTKKATPLKTAAQPLAEKPTAKSKTAGLSCDKASSIISGYGFNAVKPSDCTGQVYAFDAARDGKTYAIKLNAASGELTEVRKVR